VTAARCEGADEIEVVVPVDVPSQEAYAGADGPSSPTLSVRGDPASGEITVAADGVDGCLTEVLVDWGDRSAPTSLDVPDQCLGSTAVPPTAVVHAYSPGAHRLRVTVSSQGQIAFVEQVVTVP
jgi:hypothetical protein